LVAAIVLYYLVEEPARRWMRTMVDGGRLKTDAGADSTVHVASGKLQSIDGVQEGRPKPLSVRAG